MYRRAVDSGFLSVQLARHEEALALAPLTRFRDYHSTIRLLEAQVAKHRFSYAAHLTAASFTTETGRNLHVDPAPE